MGWYDSVAKALNQAFEDTYPEDFMGKWSPMEHYLGEDYQRHLFNTSVGGGPIAGYGLDYQQNRNAGESSNEAFKGTTDNLGKSAAILAAIFGGSSLLGGSEAGGVTGAGGEGGLPLDQSWIMGGEGGFQPAGGFNWQQFAQQGLGGMGEQAEGTGQQQQQMSFDSQGRAMDRLAEALARKQQEQRAQEMRPIY